MKPKRLAILGRKGFVAGTLIQAAANAGIDVLAIGAADIDLTATDAKVHVADRLRPEDTVVFVSALTPDRGRDVAALMANLKMAEAVVGAVQDRKVAHLIAISSDAVYEDDGAQPVTESSYRQPTSLYGIMHCARELISATSGVPLAILRPTLLYGAADTHNGYGPNRFRRSAATEGKIQLFGEGEERRDYVDIADVAELILRTAARRSVGVLNVATGRSTSFREVATLVASHFDRPIAIAGSPRVNPVTHRHFDIADLIRAFPDFEPTPLETGLARAHQAMMRSSPAART